MNHLASRLPFAVLTALVSLLWMAVPVAHGASTKPNIIFILADDLGYGDVGCFYQNSRPSPQPRMYTPQLDAMAGQGMMFLQHYSASPVCAPARASLLLGQNQGNCVIRDNQFDKALPNNHTLATVLKQSGYYCEAIGKWGLAGQANVPPDFYSDVTNTVPGYPLQHGFDEFFGFVDHAAGHVYYHDAAHALFYNYTNVTTDYANVYSTDLFFARAKKFISDHEASNPGQPFFLYLAPTAVHSGLQVPGGPYPPGSGASGGLQWPLTPTPATRDTWIHPDYTNAVTTTNYFNDVITSTNWNDTMKRYATIDRRLDDGVGDLLQLLRDLNIGTNTLVIFSSDNGPANENDFGSYTSDPRYFDSWANMDGIKRDLWEAGVREPTIAWWPGTVAANTTNNAVSAFWDWLPTFADLVGEPTPGESDGVSLVPTLTRSGTQRTRGIWYFEYNYNGSFGVDGGSNGLFARKGVTARSQLQSVRSNNFVAVRYDIKTPTDPFRLYDVVHDPHQDTNIAAFATNAPLLTTLSNYVAQARMPNASAPRPYDSELMPAVTNVLVNPGLAYAVYSGSWPWVPDLDALTPISTGTATGLDLSVASLPTNYGISFEGFITIPADGSYTFYVTDDSGAEMWIHDAHVIDDDFDRTGATVHNSILLKAGLHPFRLYYRHGSGAASLQLQYSGPGIITQTVPTAMFSRNSTNGTAESIALNDSASTPQNTPVTINILANDIAGSGPGPLTIVSVGSPLAGTALTNAIGQIIYTPNASFLGNDTFTYTMTDGASVSTATVQVGVYYSDGMVWFPFDQTSGLTTIDANGGYTGSLIGFDNDPAEWVPGKWNRALEFDGNNYVDIAGFSGILGSSPRTVAAWVNTTSTAQQPVIAWGPNANGNKWSFLVENGHARIEITSGYLEGTRIVNDGLWHFIACSYNNNFTSITNAKLYVDGTPETSFTTKKTFAVNTTSNGDVTIGLDTQGRNFIGMIDEPRIYNTALTDAQILSLCNATDQSAAAWHRRYYGNAAINWSAPDSAGHPRLLDYALGVEPWESSGAQLGIQLSVVNNTVLVRFQSWTPGTSELTYQLLSSTDLVHWAPWNGTRMAPEPSIKTGMETTLYQGPISTTNATFIRLQVALP
ncbi:sulfatase-like hydrolase/transferase [Pedosphaera parvula]|nr:sulfatase-like hydrolase/transferase [Pedosphaera parvula]